MGTLWRSETMEPIQLFLQLEGAHDTVDELSKVGMIQFKDLEYKKNAFQRNFTKEVKAADEMERRVRFFAAQVEKEEFSETDLQDLEMRKADENIEVQRMRELDARFEELERDMLEMNSNQEQLQRNYNEFIEFQHVLMKEASFFSDERAVSAAPAMTFGADGASQLGNVDEVEAGTGALGGMSLSGLGYITGAVPSTKMGSFERVLWRAVRGNLFMKKSVIDRMITDPASGENVEKTVFIVFYQGARSKQKVQKICESFGANLYPCPATRAEREKILGDVEGRLRDLEKVLSQSVTHRRQVLLNVAAHVDSWREMVMKDKAIYHTMNMFDYDEGRRCMIADGWCPVVAHDDVLLALERAQRRSGARVIRNDVQSDEKPPTYFRTNKFTDAFQNLVSSYGIARYKEVNPAVFTIVTFPFLFGVMFGDVGHGLLMTLAALALVLNEKALAGKKLNEMLQTLYDGRYLLLLMGINAVYCGALYNECFSVSMNIFGSRWKYQDGCGQSLALNSSECYQMVRTGDSIAYPFGVDPAWKGAKNELAYYNSYKMKLSVLVGVTQMCLGIIMSLFNGIYFRQPLDIIFEFIPGLTFMLSLFGYMNFLILYKWFADWTGREAVAPQLITVMIEMFLKPWEITPLGEPNATDLYNNSSNIQLYIQDALVVIALICIPLMLFPKPIILIVMHRRSLANKPEVLNAASSDSDMEAPAAEKAEHGGGHGGHGEFDASEIFVHQIIHTIEFVLGAISNTASYLRLWALSLAHSELSAVFWNRVMLSPFVLGNGAVWSFAAIFVGFAIWAAITTAVLLIMESLSAFLHALRLHWVEFQNKFYKGDGVKFTPMSYEVLLRGDED